LKFNSSRTNWQQCAPPEASDSASTAARRARLPRDPIVLALAEWTGQHITTYIAGHIL
jgi:hypothetical protein